MDVRQRVWAPHSVEGYQMGVIVDVGADTLSVEPLEASGLVSMNNVSVYLVLSLPTRTFKFVSTPLLIRTVSIWYQLEYTAS